MDNTLGSPLGKGFRHTMEKLASKFGLGSGSLAKAPSSEFYVDVEPDQDAKPTNHRFDDTFSGQSAASQEPPVHHKVRIHSCIVTKIRERQTGKQKFYRQLGRGYVSRRLWVRMQM